MIKRSIEMKTQVRSNLRGGNGDIVSRNIFEPEELPKTRLFSTMTLKPGDSIGVHPHEGEGEAYVILEGQVTVSEDGVDYILNAGDAEYCTDGHTHSIANHSDQTAIFLAIVIL